MRLLMFILLVVMVALAAAKKPPQEPKLPDNDTCGRSQLCLQCCKKMRACLDQCFFWHTDRDMCRRNCADASCNQGWHDCKEKCDLPWCKGKEWNIIPLTEPFQGVAGSVDDVCRSDGQTGCDEQVQGADEDVNGTIAHNHTRKGAMGK